MSTNPTNEHREQAREIVYADINIARGQSSERLVERVAAALSSRDAEIRELLSGFIHAGVEFDDERLSYVVMQIDRRDLEKAREMYAKLQPDQVNGASSTPKG